MIPFAFLFCSKAIPSSMPVIQTGDAATQQGRISGHVFTGGDLPLAGVAVTLLNYEVDLHRVTHTDASGAYSFTAVPTGHYLLEAFHAGYYAEYFNMAPSEAYPAARRTAPGAPHMFEQGVTLRADTTAATADFKLTSSPSVEALHDEALQTVYPPKERAQLSFSSGSFSPGLRYLALATTGIASGDPEQVWRYELATGHLVPVSPTPTQALTTQIFSVSWTGEVLHVLGTDHLGGREFEASLAKSGTPEITFKPQPFTLSFPSESLAAGPYTLTPITIHGGSVSWTARRKGERQDKTVAGALLNTPVADPAIPFFFYVPVTYPTTFLDDRIAALDLRSGKEARQRVPVSEGLQLLAAAPDADGFLVAYQVLGSCIPETNQDGEDVVQLRSLGPQSLQRQTAHVCLVHLPRPAGKGHP